MSKLSAKAGLVFIVLLLQAAVCFGNSLIEPDRILYPPLRFNPPQAERIVLENGIVLFLLEDHEVPLVEISAVFRAGSDYNPKDKEGVAELTATLMRTGGIAGMSADRVDRDIDQRAAQISFTSDLEACTATLSLHKQDVDPVLHLFAGMLRAPAFDEAKTAVAKNLMMESLSRVYDDPQRLAFREFRKMIYAGDPRGRLSTIESVGRISRQDLLTFHAGHFFPGNMRIALTGDLTRREAIDLVTRSFGSWRGGQGLPETPVPRSPEIGSVHLLSKQGPQSSILLGHIVPGKGSPDFHALAVLDFILGSGGFGSRITRDIRTERGLAYSAGAFYSARTRYGLWGAYAMTKTSSTAEVLSSLRALIQKIQDGPVSGRELAWAKRALTNRFIFSLESADKIAYQQLMLDFDGLPPDFLTTYTERIEQVTAQDVLRVARYLFPGRARILVVGDSTRLPSLSGFGEITPIEWKK